MVTSNRSSKTAAKTTAKSAAKVATKTATKVAGKPAVKTVSKNTSPKASVKTATKTAAKSASKTAAKSVANKSPSKSPSKPSSNASGAASGSKKLTLRGRSVFVVQTTSAGVTVRTAWMSEDQKLMEMPAVFPDVNYAVNLIDDLKRQVLKHFSQAAQVGAQAIANQRVSKKTGD